MSGDILKEFSRPVVGADARKYTALACGAMRDDGLWEGWLEFVPVEGDGAKLATPRETTQPNRPDLVYWAHGLTATYLEGAWERAASHHAIHFGPTPVRAWPIRRPGLRGWPG